MLHEYSRREIQVIHAKCDDVAQMLMEELGIAVPRWQLHRKLLIDCTPIDQTPGDSFCTIVIEWYGCICVSSMTVVSYP